MKTIRILLPVLALLSLAACAQWPKDSYIRNAEITTPWGTTKVEAAATGAAARNLTAEERATLLKPKSTTP